MDDQNTLGTPDKTHQRNDKRQQRRICYHQHTIPAPTRPTAFNMIDRAIVNMLSRRSGSTSLLNVVPQHDEPYAITYFVHRSALAACAIRGLAAKHPNEKMLCKSFGCLCQKSACRCFLRVVKLGDHPYMFWVTSPLYSSNAD